MKQRKRTLDSNLILIPIQKKHKTLREKHIAYTYLIAEAFALFPTKKFETNLNII